MGHVLNDGQINILFIIKRLHIAIPNSGQVYFFISLMKQICDKNK